MMGMTENSQRSLHLPGVRAPGELVAAFLSDESGATAIEYCLIVSLIFLAVLTGVQAVADSNSETYNTITTTIDSAIN